MLLVVHVHVRVKPECVEAFKAATLENARNSVQEPGIARFDVIQQSGDPARFILVEVYRTPQAPAAAQGNGALCDLARHGGGDDGGTAHRRKVLERLPRRRGLVMRFEFATATRIVFGEGAFQEVAPAVKAMGRRALLVTRHGAALGRWPKPCCRWTASPPSIWSAAAPSWLAPNSATWW